MFKIRINLNNFFSSRKQKMVKQQVIEKVMVIRQHQVHVNVLMKMKVMLNMEHL